MGIIDIASSKSVWRGMDYYKQKKVLSCEENDDGTYEGDVAGSDNKKYHVHLDMIHPRKSKCNCPLANGKQVICKHIVAMSFCVDASEADRFKNEKTIYASEEEERRAKRIETERLLLREYTMDDFDALYEIMSDAETMQHYPAPFDEARTGRWIEWNLENYARYGFGLWAIVLKETGEFIGDCGITIQNIDGEKLPEIGYHIHKKFWRHGYAKEATKAVRDWAFENTDYPSLYSYCKYTNEASYKTAEAIGMHFDKEYPDEANKITHVSVIHRAATGRKLASVAKNMAQMPLHGFTEGKNSNLESVIMPFPGWTLEEADRLWCAAFVYYCCKEAGFAIPIRPKECKTCHLAGCIAWEEFAIGDPRIEYHKSTDGFVPGAGDIVLYDRVFENR